MYCQPYVCSVINENLTVCVYRSEISQEQQIEREGWVLLPTGLSNCSWASLWKKKVIDNVFFQILAQEDVSRVISCDLDIQQRNVHITTKYVFSTASSLNIECLDPWMMQYQTCFLSSNCFGVIWLFKNLSTNNIKCFFWKRQNI